MVVAVIPQVQLAIRSRDQAWSFAFENSQTGDFMEATDVERDWSGDRLTLLALVRGIESLDGRFRVEIVTASRYVFQGLCYGLENWRENQWRWESFGLLVSVKNCDLWQRVDRALKYHEIESVRLCREATFETDALVNGRAARDSFVRRVRQRRTALRIHHLRHVVPTQSNKPFAANQFAQTVA